MVDYIQASKLVRRERETETWLRSKDWSEIVMRIHELEDQVEDLQGRLDSDEEEQ